MRLRRVDEALQDGDIIERVRWLDRRLIMQLFYVRERIIENWELPDRTRIGALDQLEKTLEHLPNFIMADMHR